MYLKNIFLALISIFLLFSCEDPSNNENKKDSKNTSDQKINMEHIEGQIFKLKDASETGIDFANMLIDDPLDDQKNVMSWPHYFNGGGVAIGDLNKDGLQDIVFSGNEVDNRIYINKGDLKFEDVTEKANINENRKWVTGVSLADVNQDGWLDIYFCQASPFELPPSERKNLLFINNHDLTFTEAAKRYGLDDGNHGVQAVFFDMEKDGDLDCFVFNSSRYVRVQIGTVLKHLEKKENLEAASSNLYRNDKGKFTRITEEAGMLRHGFGLGNFLADLNGDGYMDIYQANDYSVPDFMYINQKDGTFRDEVKLRTKQLSWFAMGADCADINNDGKLDIGVVDMAATDHVRGKTLMAPMDPELFYISVDYLKNQRQHMFNTLQLNNGDDTYSNIAGLAHVQNSEWSWAALFADFDNDTYKDYFVATGFRRYVRDNDSRLRTAAAREKYGDVPRSMRKDLYAQIPQVPLNNFMYHNNGNLQFHEISKDWGLGQETYSNGAAYADLDRDGDLDLIVNNIEERAFLYENTLDGKKKYLRFGLESRIPKEGTKVTIEYDGKLQFQEYSPVRGYLSVVDNFLHFGLGDLKMVEKVTVTWPDGKSEILENVNADQEIVLKHENATNINIDKPSSIPNYFAEHKNSYFRHLENTYNDFEKEVLVPYQQSALGPQMSVEDLNGDGLDDIYIGGAAGQTGAILTQNADGSFAHDFGPFQANKDREEMGSCFFDADGDGDKDLYVINGGNEFKDRPVFLQDKLYINNNGKFTDESFRLPKIQDAGLRVKASDIDGDGDEDLFIGGRLKPGLYPNPARSYILQNDNGKFSDVTAQWSEELVTPGMVNDFLWTDFDADGKEDLIIAGEWMPISFYKNTGSSFTNVSSQYMDEEHKGWWFKLHEVDIDNDGDKDLVAGNLGLNSKFHTSYEKPMEMLANDFDGNGTCDVVMTKDYKGKSVPVRGRQCSSEQMPFIEDKFETYGEFAQASIEDILGQQKIDGGIRLQVNTFENVIFINNGGKYTPKALPIMAQAFPIYGIESIDINKDGLQDLVLCGNLYNMEIETPRIDSGNGLTLINKGNGEFESYGIATGLITPFDAKDMHLIQGKELRILVLNNNGPLQIFDVFPKKETSSKLTAIK